METSCTRRLEFDSGHRVLRHGGKCRHLHGHRYVAEITAVARKLNDLGMVVDFSVLKEVVGKWIDEHWDHNMLLNSNDPLLQVVPSPFEKAPYVFTDENPTAETMAGHLYGVANQLLMDAGVGVTVTQVRLYETPNCWADYPSIANTKHVDIVYKNFEGRGCCGNQ